MALSNKYDAIILGGGGAGLMCALTAGQRGKRVLVIDHASGPGKKILISGGGRCNFTNVNATTTHAQERYLSANLHFAKSALGRYTPQDFIELVRSHNIAFHEKTLGQLFCDGSARQIVAMLMAECDKSAAAGGHVDFVFDAPVGEVTHDGNDYHVTYNGVRAQGGALVIATGGPSIPKMGATAFAYDLGRQFGLKIVEPRPALVPLTLGGDDILFRELSGVSAEVVARHQKTAFREAALFTHRGLSGPAILQISSYWAPQSALRINLTPGETLAETLVELKARSRKLLANELTQRLPQRLATQWLDNDPEIGKLRDRPISEIADKLLRRLGEQLQMWRLTPSGTEGYAKAEVTAGGVDTRHLDPQTMGAKAQPGLYFIGEVTDVTGWLGGYNFQWAWSSGVACARAMAAKAGK